jgi:osmotically inducible protein OsmC
MISKAQIVWRGDACADAAVPWKSGALEEAPYALTTRFESGEGRKPGEMLAAAHSGCFTSAPAFSLQVAGYTPTEPSAEAVIAQEPGERALASVLRTNAARKGTKPDESDFRHHGGTP